MIASTNAVAKIAAVVAGLGLVAMSFASFAPAARAATAAELQAQVDALLAQIAGLGGGSSSASMTFTMDLTLGSTGAEVTALQNWLISKGYSIPAGATGYFGAQTQAALAAFQAANGISPAAGYFGPITRAKVNGMGGGSTGGSTGGDDDMDSDLSGGEASLEDLNGRSGEDDDVEEGGTAEVAEFEFDVEDADIEIERLDLTFETTATGGEEDEPWDTFDTITIMNGDGDELASEDVSDEDEWLDEDEPFVFRFTNLDYVVEEGEQGTLIVQVEAQSSVDGSDTTIPWTVYIDTDGIRGRDGEGIEQYLGDDSEDVSFDVVEEGEGEELNVQSSSEDPDATTLQVEEDETSDWFTVFAFELEAEENDIEIDEIGVQTSTSDSDISSVVNDMKLVVDGEEFDDFDESNLGGAATTTFDIDKDFTVGADESVTVEFMVEFKAQEGNYATGTTFSASTTGSLVTGEGADDVTADGSAQGETHTLQVDGIEVEVTDTSATATVVDGSDNDYATYTIEVEITAVGDDAFISQTATSAYTFEIENASNDATLGSSTATTTTIDSSADSVGGAYRVNEGDTETFTFTMTLNPSTVSEGSSFRAQLLTILFGDTSSDTDASTWTATPENDYQTSGVLIND